MNSEKLLEKLNKLYEKMDSEKNINIIKAINERGQKINITDEYKFYLHNFIINGKLKDTIIYLSIKKIT